MGSGQFQFLSQIICCRNSRNTIWTKSHKIAIVGEDEGRFSPVDTLRSENNLWMTRRPLVIDASPLTGEPAAQGGGAAGEVPHRDRWPAGLFHNRYQGGKLQFYLQNSATAISIKDGAERWSGDSSNEILQCTPLCWWNKVE